MEQNIWNQYQENSQQSSDHRSNQPPNPQQPPNPLHPPNPQHPLNPQQPPNPLHPSNPNDLQDWPEIGQTYKNYNQSYGPTINAQKEFIQNRNESVIVDQSNCHQAYSSQPCQQYNQLSQQPSQQQSQQHQHINPPHFNENPNNLYEQASVLNSYKPPSQLPDLTPLPKLQPINNISSTQINTAYNQTLYQQPESQHNQQTILHSVKITNQISQSDTNTSDYSSEKVTNRIIQNTSSSNNPQHPNQFSDEQHNTNSYTQQQTLAHSTQILTQPIPQNIQVQQIHSNIDQQFQSDHSQNIQSQEKTKLDQIEICEHDSTVSTFFKGDQQDIYNDLSQNSQTNQESTNHANKFNEHEPVIRNEQHKSSYIQPDDTFHGDSCVAKNEQSSINTPVSSSLNISNGVQFLIGDSASTSGNPSPPSSHRNQIINAEDIDVMPNVLESSLEVTGTTHILGMAITQSSIECIADSKKELLVSNNIENQIVPDLSDITDSSKTNQNNISNNDYSENINRPDIARQTNDELRDVLLASGLHRLNRPPSRQKVSVTASSESLRSSRARSPSVPEQYGELQAYARQRGKKENKSRSHTPANACLWGDNAIPQMTSQTQNKQVPMPAHPLPPKETEIILTDTPEVLQPVVQLLSGNGAFKPINSYPTKSTPSQLRSTDIDSKENDLSNISCTVDNQKGDIVENNYEDSNIANKNTTSNNDIRRSQDRDGKRGRSNRVRGSSKDKSDKEEEEENRLSIHELNSKRSTYRDSSKNRNSIDRDSSRSRNDRDRDSRRSRNERDQDSRRSRNDKNKDSSRSRNDKDRDSSRSRNDRDKDSRKSRNDKDRDSSRSRNNRDRDSSRSRNNRDRDSSRSRNNRDRDSSRSRNDRDRDSRRSRNDKDRDSSRGRNDKDRDSSRSRNFKDSGKSRRDVSTNRRSDRNRELSGNRGDSQERKESDRKYRQRKGEESERRKIPSQNSDNDRDNRSRRTRRKERSVSTHKDYERRDRKAEKRGKDRSVSKHRNDSNRSREKSDSLQYVENIENTNVMTEVEYADFQADYYEKQLIHYQNTGFYQDPSAFTIDPNRTNDELSLPGSIYDTKPKPPSILSDSIPQFESDSFVAEEMNEIVLQKVDTPEPQRLTPTLFSLPHSRVSFMANGQLVKVLANDPLDGQPAQVVITDISEIISRQNNDYSIYPGPLIKGDTHKNDVLLFCQKKLDECKVTKDFIDRDSAVLIWKYLQLLIKQNGVVIGTDIADLLLENYKDTQYMENEKQTISEQEIISRFRNLLLHGQKKDALETAIKNKFWGHALFLASKMDSKTHAAVMTRFANVSMNYNDPLQTLYQLMSGRQPASVTLVADENYGSWHSHLAMILSNESNKKRNQIDYRSIVTMGDTLATKGFLYASQFCYMVAPIELSSFSEKSAKLILIGSNNSNYSNMSKFASDIAIQCTEVYSYAKQLSKGYSPSPSLQPFKLLYAIRLIECGHIEQTLHYLENISRAVLLKPSLYNESLTCILFSLSDRLKEYDPVRQQLGQESIDPAWLTCLASLVHSQKEGIKGEFKSDLTTIEAKLIENSYTRDKEILAEEVENIRVHELQNSITYPIQYTANQDSCKENINNPSVGEISDQHNDIKEIQMGIQYDVLNTVQCSENSNNYEYSKSNENNMENYGEVNNIVEYDQYNNVYQTAQNIPQTYDTQVYDVQTYDPQAYQFQTQSNISSTINQPSEQNTDPLLMSQHSSLSTETNLPINSTSCNTQFKEFNNSENTTLESWQDKDLNVASSNTNITEYTTPSQSPPVFNDEEKPKKKQKLPGMDEDEVPKKEFYSNKVTSSWLGSLVSKLSGKNEVNLPDDKNPAIIWDEDKKCWINTNDDENEPTSSAAPPPKDSEINTQVTGPSLDSINPTLPPTNGSPGNKFSRGKRGGKQYVDVLGSNSTSKSVTPNILMDAMISKSASVPTNMFVPQAMSRKSSELSTDKSELPQPSIMHEGCSQNVSEIPGMPVMFNPSQFSSINSKANKRRMYPKK